MQIYENKREKSSSPVHEVDMTLHSPDNKAHSPKTGYEDLEARLSSPDADKFLYQLIKLFDYVSLHSASPDLWNLANDIERLEADLADSQLDLQPLTVATETFRKLFTIMQTLPQLKTATPQPKASPIELENRILFLEQSIAQLKTKYNKFRKTATSSELKSLQQRLVKIEVSILRHSPYESILELVENISSLPDNESLLRRTSCGLKALHQVITDFRNNTMSKEGQSA